MVNTQGPRPAPRHQSLGARQWQELRQAARLARSEGVEITRFGYTIRPAIGFMQTRQPHAREEAHAPAPAPTAPAPTAPAPEPTLDDSMRTPTRPPTRNARRALDFRAHARVAALWVPFVLRLKRHARFLHRWATFTSWKERRAIVLRLRDLLWRAWTQPQTGSSAGGISDELSLRDAFRRDRARHAQVLRDAQLARTITEQDQLLSVPDGQGPTRGVDEAGIRTPASARKGKKPRGRPS